MNPVSALTYPFRSKNWPSVLFAQSISVILIIIGWFAAFGYAIRVAGEVANGYDDEMPNWNFGENFRVGLLALIGYALYLIPLLMLAWLMDGIGVSGSALTTALFVLVVGTVYGGFILVALVRYAATEEFSSFMEIGKNISVALQNIVPVIVASFLIAIGYAVVIVLMSASGLLICIPLILLGYFSIYAGHIIGQLGAKLDISPDEYKKDEPDTGGFR